MMDVPSFSKKQIIVFSPKEGDKVSYRNDNMLIKDKDEKIKYQCTCYQIFAVFIIGNVSLTSGIIQRASKYKYTICLLTTSLRPYQLICNPLEGNTYLHQKQYNYDGMEYAQFIILNKIINQRETINKIRKKVQAIKEAISVLDSYIEILNNKVIDNRLQLMGIEGSASRVYFPQVFSNTKWKGRKPRIKQDYINATLDIGYTFLFNFVDCILQLFGFDVYKGILHTNFYMRKSLVCDLVEPFRPIIDWKVRCAINLNQIKEDDFEDFHGQYVLKYKLNSKYAALFTEALLEHKVDIFKFIQSYYRCFMKENNPNEIEKFLLNGE